MKCDRCQRTFGGFSMSYLNLDMCCTACLVDEQRLPSYAAGKARELEEVKKGNRNFPGVGLTEADHEFLAARRAQRP